MHPIEYRAESDDSSISASDTSKECLHAKALFDLLSISVSTGRKTPFGMSIGQSLTETLREEMRWIYDSLRVTACI
ncbi:hypothetical protein CDAR_298821 [Caerostris darwini]|uniref:Uncharacterized protein n=1 Tax=Caerostris darwini TaxID=1538125 RepID=A0AAV4TPY4_9ARAC|nr:hypothetical protein CDAR_298821 [Caerostris darwini]